MKFVFAAVAFAAIACGGALAQAQGQAAGAATAPVTPATTPAANVVVPPSRCPDLPAAPSLVDGATATGAQMQTTQQTIVAWDAAYRASMACRLAETEEALAISQKRREDYNAAAGVLNGAISAWTAEVNEFNARNPRQRR